MAHTRTVFCNFETGMSTAGANLFIFGGHGDTTGTIPLPEMLRAGTLANLRIWWATANGAGQTRHFALKKNGSTVATYSDAGAGATSLVQSGTLTTVTATDKIQITQTSTGSPASIQLWLTVDFASNDDSTVYGFGYGPGGTSLNQTVVNYASPLGGPPRLTSFPTVVNAPGTIQQWTASFQNPAGAGQSWTGVLLLNGVAQDGTGGTPNTTISISGAVTTSVTSSAFTLATAKLDTIEARFTPSGGPPAGGTVACMFAWLPTNPNDALVATSPPDNLTSGSVTEFVAPYGIRDWVLTESDAVLRGGDTPLALQHLYVRLSQALTSGQGWTFTLRKNGADTAITVTLGSGDQIATYAGSDVVTINTGDTWCIKAVGSSAPTLTSARISFLTDAPAIRGSAVFGEKGTVKKSRAIAASLDGNTNVLAEEGMFKVFGKFAVTGIATFTSSIVLTTRLAFSQITQATAASKLLGRGSASGAGDFQEITLGTGLTMTGTTLSASGGGSSSALVLLEERTASASASLNFTTRNVGALTGATFQSDYDEYLIELINILPATDNVTLSLRVSTNGGSSYDSGSNYKYTYHYKNSAGTAGTVGSNSGTSFEVAGNVDNAAAGGGLCGQYRLFAPLGTTPAKHLLGAVTFLHNDTNYYRTDHGGWYVAANDVDAFQIFASSGNLASGIGRVFGVAKA